MKITVQHYDSEFSFVEPDDLSIDDAVTLMRKVLFCIGFNINQINDYIPHPDETIKVTVKGNIVKCDSPLVEIINLDEKR